MVFSAMLEAKGAEVNPTTLTIGVLHGPHATVMHYVQEIAAKNGLVFKILEYTDASQLNADLRAHKIDANDYQDRRTLEADNAAHGYALQDVAYTITLPLGIYSKKFSSLHDLPLGATLAIPNERVHIGHTLLLLHNYGLIGLAEQAGTNATLADIVANPKALQFTEVDQRQLLGMLDKVAAVALSYPVAQQVGLAPARDALAMDDARSPYASVLAVRAEDRTQPWVEPLVKAYHSDPIKQFILTNFQDSVRRPW